jgi:hypothetical protein
MFNKTLSLALIGSLILSAAFSPSVLARSKSEKEAAFAAKVKAGIAKLGTGPDARLTVKLRDKTKLTGYVSQIGEDSFVIADAKTGAATEVPYPNVIQVKGNNLSVGAAIAIGVAVAGATLLILFLIAKSNGA